MKIRESDKKLLWGVIFHAVILGFALALSYGSYKELMREIEPLTRDVKDSTKAAFPWAILLFSGLYFIFFRLKNRLSKMPPESDIQPPTPDLQSQPIFLNIGQYVFMLILYGVLINIIFSSEGRNILIPLNISVIYFAILLVVFWHSGRLLTFLNAESNIQYQLLVLQDWLPPIIYRFLQANLPRVQAYIKEKPSASFIIGFMTLLIICALLLIFKAEKTAENIANIAYFSLVIGVSIEVYQLVMYGERDEEE